MVFPTCARIPMKRLLGLSVVGFVALMGCVRPPVAVVPTAPPKVIVAMPVVRMVTDYEDFTGRTVASKSVDIKSRVTGHLMKQHFIDGADVQEGDPLFDIDPKTYEADYEKAKAAVVQAEAKEGRLNRDFKRAEGLLPTKSISPEEVDRITGEFAEAVAAVKVAMRQVEAAKNFVDYTHIRSPITGRISKRSFDPGNLVKADETLLTSIVATDTMYADFDIDDRTVLKVRRLIELGTVKSARDVKTAVRIGLPDEEGFSMDGTITFVDNQLNPGTGTIRIRAEMKNPAGLLSPGMFIRVRVPIGSPKSAILVPEVAIGTDQGLKYVFVVNENNEVESRRVELGLPQESFRVVRPVPNEPKSGVKETDRVIVKGLQRVREKAKVDPKFESAPTPPTADKG